LVTLAVVVDEADAAVVLETVGVTDTPGTLAVRIADAEAPVDLDAEPVRERSADFVAVPERLGLAEAGTVVPGDAVGAPSQRPNKGWQPAPQYRESLPHHPYLQ
jgi:hypothetical protein